MTARVCAILLGLAATLLVPRVALADSWGCDGIGILDGGPEGYCCDVHDSCYATFGCSFSPARAAAAAACAAADIAPNTYTCSACTAALIGFATNDPCYICDAEVQHCIGANFPGPGECTGFNGLGNVCGTARNDNNKFGCVDDRFCQPGNTCNTANGLCSGGLQPPPQPPAIVPWFWPFNPFGCVQMCSAMGECGWAITPCGLWYFGGCGSGETCQNNQCVQDCQWYDCAGVCNGNAQYDCAGICNGGTQYDDCGVCGGDGSSCRCQWYDCAGVCNGGAQYDCAGVCNGSAQYDCAGVCNGGAQYDCAGICNGGTQYDECGVCGGDGSECGGGCGGGCGCGCGCGGGCGCGAGCGYGGGRGIEEGI